MSTPSAEAKPAPDAPPAPRPSTPPSDLPRSLGRYVLLRRIARGGMGEVFLASTTGLEGAERPVVVKIIRREHATDPSFIARFLDEARVQAQLTHNGVAQVLDAAIEDATGEPYAVVEYVEGRSLGDVRARALAVGQRMAWPDAVAVATMIAEALAHVHERQDAAGRALSIVHRDLSPQNVMLGFGGDIKIIDFGTARGQNRRCHTVAGVVFAKPGYVAPEVANGDPGDARVDIYALGVMLWELCAGRRFLQGEAQDHMAKVAKNEQNPPAIAETVGAPADLDSIIAKLTAFERDARYLASRTAANDLARLLSAAPVLASGERSVRARAAELMRNLFPGEPQKSRREFARLVAAARAQNAMSPPTPAPRPVHSAEAARREAEEEGLLPGTRYQLGREIGRGASSVVYDAEHVDLGRRVALKVLAAGSAEYAERFRSEARALERLSHPGLTRVHDFGVASDGRCYSAMELLEGETLEGYLARLGGCDWREALGVADKMLAALEAAHAAGLVHRDIKPANVFLTLGGEVKLLDFGIARGAAEAGATSEAVGAATVDGVTLFGTPEYMAPEQAASGQVDHRADIYALGCVLYEMLTGRIPFAEGSAVAILDAKTKGSPERPRDRAPSRGIPDPVDELVMRALARHPTVRFQSATEMRTALFACMEAPGRRRAGRRVLGFGALAAAMAFAGVLLVGKVRELRGRPLPAQVVAMAEPVKADPPPSGEPADAPATAGLFVETDEDDAPGAAGEDEGAPGEAAEAEGEQGQGEATAVVAAAVGKALPAAPAKRAAPTKREAREAAPEHHRPRAGDGKARGKDHPATPAADVPKLAAKAKDGVKVAQAASAEDKPAKAESDKPAAAPKTAQTGEAVTAGDAASPSSKHAAAAVAATPGAGEPADKAQQADTPKPEKVAAGESSDKAAAPAPRAADKSDKSDKSSASADDDDDDEREAAVRGPRPSSTSAARAAPAKPSKKVGPRRKPKSKRAQKNGS